MEEARAVLARLERIDALERGGAGAGPLLQELRALAREAAAWAASDGDPRARAAAAALGAAIDPVLHRDHETPVPCPLPAATSPSDSTSQPVRR